MLEFSTVLPTPSLYHQCHMMNEGQ